MKKPQKRWGKKVLSSSLAVSLLMSSALPTNVFAASARSELQEVFNGLVSSEKESLYSNSLQFELEENPIKDGVDITSEEYQPIIIQFKSLPLVEALESNNGIAKYSLENEINEEHETFKEFLSSMSKERSSYSIKHSYYNTFNGVAIDVKGTDIEALLESGVIKAVWKDEVAMTEPESLNSEVETYDLNSNSRMVSSTPLIEVDKLREEGITGEGIKVGVLDTGVDYNHPDIKDNYKGGYDFVDNDNDPMETTYDDWKNSGQTEYYGESSYYTSHGTHVSGTIAATGSNTESEFAVTGIAPEVDLYGYRVLGPYGMGSSSDIIAGIEKAVEDGMDVINLSLGISVTDPLYPSSVACNNAALAGTIPVVANGNAGPSFSTLGSPGSSALSISVGASSTSIKLETFNISFSNDLSVNGRLLSKNYQGLDTFTNEDFEIVYGGLGSIADLEGIDANGKVLLIDRGEITFVEKLTNAREAGAVAVIVANNLENEELNVYLGEAVDTLHSVGITKEQGETIKEAIIGSEEAIKVNFQVNGTTTTEGDLLADFSSRGPSSDETIKPDVVAPGVAIFSTYPEYINSPEDGIDYSIAYSRISGTSMATPHVAGVVALMLQNNPELSASDVKVALMNTCEDLAEDYAINAMGAGRINAYKAVHSDVAVKVLDKTYSLDENDEKIEINYNTGSLSYDRLRKDNEVSTKSLPIEIDNNSSESKSFNVSVRYLGEGQLAQDAVANGVTVNVPENIVVNSNESNTFDATISIPFEASVGRYEGYVILTNTEDTVEEYALPFSATYVIPGIESIELSRPAISNDLEMMHFAKIIGIAATVEVSSPLSTVSLYVKDYDTKEVIGYLGTADFSNVPGGSSQSFYALNSRAAYFPMKDGKIVDNIVSSLKDGKYIIEFIGKDLDTDEVYTIEKNILVDNEDAQMTFDKEAGVYEVSDDMITTEEYLGGSYEAFWVHGNVTDNSISLLQEMGYNTDASDIIISGFLNGMPSVALNVNENGDFKFGIEKTDLERGQVCEFSPMPIDVATSQNLYKQPRYFFVKEGTPYTGVTLDKEEISLNDNITATVTTHNLSAGSTFDMVLAYVKGFEAIDVKVNSDLQKILDKNGYTANIEKSISGEITRELNIKLSILDKEGNPVNISGTNGLVDVEFKLTYDSESEFYREYIECRSIEISDNDGNGADMSFNSTYEGVDIVPTKSTIFVSQLGEGFGEAISNGTYTEDLDKYMWIEDNNGNKYEVEYNDNMATYMAVDIPVSSEEYTVVTALPGHFRKEARFVPSRVVNGKTVSKVYYLLGSEFYRFIGAGDVNGDGWIDILDALEVEKYYGKEVDYNINPVDFNFDGIVNSYDMDYIVKNFGEYNEQVAQDEAILSFEGRTLNDILDATGYNTEARLESIEINKNQLNLEVGSNEKLSVIVEPEGYEGKIEWKSYCEDIATVDENGVVTGVNKGTTIIKASIDKGQLNLFCYVTVTKDGNFAVLESITPDKKHYDMRVGDKEELGFTVNPEDYIIKSVNYISAADSIATVVDGKVIAKAPGTTIITADINSGEAKVTWEITVTEADIEKPENPETPSEPESPNNPEKPGDSNNNDNSNGGNSGNSGNNGSNGSNNGNSGSVDVKPNNNQGGKLPSTGGVASLPIVAMAITMIATGTKMRKRK